MADFDFDKFIGSAFGEETETNNAKVEPNQSTVNDIKKVNNATDNVDDLADEIPISFRKLNMDPIDMDSSSAKKNPSNDDNTKVDTSNYSWDPSGNNYTNSYTSYTDQINMKRQKKMDEGDADNTNANQTKKQKLPLIALILLIALIFILLTCVVYKLVNLSKNYHGHISISSSNPFGSFDWDSDDNNDDGGISGDYGIPSDDSDDDDSDSTDGDADGSNSQIIPKNDSDIDSMLKGQQEEVEGKDYYVMDNYLADDLDYYVEFKTYQYASSDGTSEVYIKYPVVLGSNTNVDMISNAVSREALYWMEAIETGELDSINGDGGPINLYIKGYVTYMDENVMSVAYSERITIADTDMAQIISVNVDINSGMLITNNQIIEVDTDFATEFMERCIEQNGSDTLGLYYGPDDVCANLKDNQYLIIFYTPLGLEIGLNIPYGGWVTATYTDYEELLISY